MIVILEPEIEMVPTRIHKTSHCIHFEPQPSLYKKEVRAHGLNIDFINTSTSDIRDL